MKHRSEKANNRLALTVPAGTSKKQRQQVLQRWYRKLLQARIQEVLPKWEAVVGLRVADCRIRRMKTRWGSCNSTARRVWLNSELVKKPQRCLEYVLVHEMVHLLERNHNDRFRSYMDKFMPQWRHYRDELNCSPLAHEDWRY